MTDSAMTDSALTDRVIPDTATTDTAGVAPGGPRWARRLVAVGLWMAVAAFGFWAVGRLFGLERGFPLVQLMAFTPYVAGAALAVPLLAAALRRWPAAAVSAAVAVALVSCVLPRSLADGGALPAGPTLRVLTANMLVGGADPAAIVRIVREQKVDLLALQELTPDAERALARAGLEVAREGVAGCARVRRAGLVELGDDQPVPGVVRRRLPSQLDQPAQVRYGQRGVQPGRDQVVQVVTGRPPDRRHDVQQPAQLDRGLFGVAAPAGEVELQTDHGQQAGRALRGQPGDDRLGSVQVNGLQQQAGQEVAVVVPAPAGAQHAAVAPAPLLERGDRRRQVALLHGQARPALEVRGDPQRLEPRLLRRVAHALQQLAEPRQARRRHITDQVVDRPRGQQPLTGPLRLLGRLGEQ